MSPAWLSMASSGVWVEMCCVWRSLVWFVLEVMRTAVMEGVISWRVDAAGMVLGMTTSQNAQTGTGMQPDMAGRAEQKESERTTAESAASEVGRRGKGGRRGTVRLAALRQARAVKMARDASRVEREASGEAARADFYQAKSESEEIMRAATERAQQIMAAAQERCAQPRHHMHLAVARLHELGETAVGLRELTGLGAVALREILEEHTDGRRLSGPRRRPSSPSSARAAGATASDSSAGSGWPPATA